MGYDISLLLDDHQIIASCGMIFQGDVLKGGGKKWATRLSDLGSVAIVYPDGLLLVE